MAKSIEILLIEDDETKRQAVLSVVEREFPSSHITTAASVRSAIDALARQSFDLVVADMSLPTFDIEIRERGGTPRPFGGIEVFDYLERIENAVPVLVVTSYPALSDGKRSLSVRDLEKQLRHDYSDNFAGIVYFDSSYSDWELRIADFLFKTFG